MKVKFIYCVQLGAWEFKVLRNLDLPISQIDILQFEDGLEFDLRDSNTVRIYTLEGELQIINSNPIKPLGAGIEELREHLFQFRNLSSWVIQKDESQQMISLLESYNKKIFNAKR